MIFVIPENILSGIYFVLKGTSFDSHLLEGHASKMTFIFKNGIICFRLVRAV